MAQDNMSKALDAVDSLAALVKALRHTTIDRSEYETLLCNQTDEYSEYLFHAMHKAFDNSPVALSYEERQQMVLDYAGKPADAYTLWSYDKDVDGDDCHLRQSSEIEFSDYSTMRLFIPAGYTKEEAMQGLKDLAEYIERDFDLANVRAQDIAKRELPSSFGAADLPF